VFAQQFGEGIGGQGQHVALGPGGEAEAVHHPGRDVQQDRQRQVARAPVDGDPRIALPDQHRLVQVGVAVRRDLPVVQAGAVADAFAMQHVGQARPSP
jgi:hypothetical protein